MTNITPKQLCEIFFEIEEKFDALDQKIQNIKIWQLMRMDLYYIIASKYNIEEQGHSKISRFHTFKALGGYIKNSFIYNPFIKNKCDIVVFSHPRSKYVEDKYIDIYTHYFLEALKNEEKNFIEIEIALMGTHKRSKHDKLVYADAIVLATKFLKYFIFFKLTKDESDFINSINTMLGSYLGEKVDISNVLINGIKTHKVKYFLYKKLFNKIKPSCLYIVPAYGNGVIVKAAKDSNIRVVELQHGVFSHYHLGYSYPNRKEELDYFPDEFIVWGEYWKNLISLPIDEKYIKIKPFEFLEIYKKKYQDIEKKHQLVVLSQGNIGNKIAGLLVKKLALFKNLKIIYKLHPGEYDRYNTYEKLSELIREHGNIEIVEDIDLYYLLATSKYQLGVNSTALFEGKEFGCETILFDTEGIEYMDKFIEDNALFKTDDMFLTSETLRDISL